MSMSTEAPATPRQLSYLRALAARTATTFAYPATRRQASVEIDRMRKLRREPRASRHDPGEDTEGGVYATAVHESELTGYGSQARWLSQPPQTRSPQVPRTQLARYSVSAGERVLYAERTAATVGIVDRPGSGVGRSYLVERDLDASDAELRALIADYLAQARELDEVPMACAALAQLLGRETADA